MNSRLAPLFCLFAVTLTAIPGTAPASAPRIMEAGGLPAEAAALLMSEGSGGLLTMQATVIPRMLHSRGEIDFEVTLQARGVDVLDGQAKTARLEVFAYALDARNTVKASLLKVIEMEGEGLKDRVAASGIAVSGRIRLAPGRYSLRMLVRNPASSAVGLRRLAIEVPEPPTRETVLFPPLFDEPFEAWVRASGAEATSDSSGKTLLAGSAWSVWPVLSPHQDHSFEILAYALGDPGELRLELSPQVPGGGWGEPLLVEIPVLARDQPAPGWDRISSQVPRQTVPPGNYRVRLVTGAARPVRSTDLPLFSSPEPTPGTQVWAGLLERPRRRARDTPAVAPNPGATQLGVPRVELRAELLRVLAEVGDGRREAAIERLTRVQEKAVRGSGVVIEALRDFELDLVRSLTRGSPEGLAPIVDFYLAAYLEQLADGRRLLCSHNRLLLAELAQLEVDRRDSPTARRHAADTLIQLATASNRRLTAQSEELYLLALELDPANEAALLSLITGYERRADYSSAIDLLQQLLRQWPDHREGRLRLAVNQGRTRESRASRQLLVDLTSTGPADWIRAVAYQELASRHLDQGEIQELQKLLADARTVFPDDEKLRLLEAFTLDAQNQPQRAGKLLERAPESAATPRYIYGQGLLEILNRLGREQTDRTDKEMAALREALATVS